MSPGEHEPSLGVVTVSYGSDAVLARFLASVGPGADGVPTSVVVADNRPAEAIQRIANAYAAHYLPLPDNPGYGAAINAAVGMLPDSVAWVLISNPDVVIDEGAITVLRESGETDDRIGSVGPAVRDDAGAIYPSARRVPSLRTGIGHALLAPVWPQNPWSRAYRDETSPYRREAGWLSGSCLLIRRTAFESVGGFDPAYFMYFEDVDLGYRLGHSGWLNLYEPGASVVHSGAHSTQRASAAMLRAHHRSAERFLETKYKGFLHGPTRLALRLGLRLRLRVLVRALERG